MIFRVLFLGKSYRDFDQPIGIIIPKRNLVMLHLEIAFVVKCFYPVHDTSLCFFYDDSFIVIFQEIFEVV